MKAELADADLQFLSRLQAGDIAGKDLAEVPLQPVDVPDAGRQAPNSSKPMRTAGAVSWIKIAVHGHAVRSPAGTKGQSPIPGYLPKK